MKNTLPLLLICCFLFAARAGYSQVIVTVAGNGTAGFAGDGHPAIDAEINSPYGVAVDDSGNLFIYDVQNFRVRKVSPAYGGTITTIAGNGTCGQAGDNGPGIYAQVCQYYLAVDHHNNVYIANGNKIRKVTPSDTITTFAGTGVDGYNGDHISAVTAQLKVVENITVDRIGNIFFIDKGNFRVRKIDTAGIITTIAGNGIAGFSPDGSRGDTSMLTPVGGIKTDKIGNVFFGDNGRIRKIDTTGIITTVAGNGILGYTGDSSIALMAQIDGDDIDLDSTGNLYIADGSHSVIRMVNTSGIIYTIAGSVGGYGGDWGNPLNARFCSPQGIAVGHTGDIFIGDVCNERVRMITNRSLNVDNLPSARYGLTISPNPCRENCAIQVNTTINEEAEISIMDINGVKHNSYKTRTDIPISIQSLLPPGVYMISATTAHEHYTGKLIVQ